MKSFPTHIVAVAGIVENEKGQVLLIKNLKGAWVWTGGQVENGENLFEAVLREIREESGIAANVNALVAVSSNTSSHQGHSGYGVVPTKVIFDFACVYTGGELIAQTDETEDARWVDKLEAKNYITLPTYKARYAAYLSYGGNVRYLSYASHPAFSLDISREI
jgi:ADP-ribose pyrophosphatase YjhB (NUDIX family)